MERMDGGGGYVPLPRYLTQALSGMDILCYSIFDLNAVFALAAEINLSSRDILCLHDTNRNNLNSKMPDIKGFSVISC